MKIVRDSIETLLDQHSFKSWWRRECRERFADQDYPDPDDPSKEFYKNLRAENLRRAKAAGK